MSARPHSRRPIVGYSMAEATRQTIILAAGHGSRLQGNGHAVPKPLTAVGGRPLIEHAILQAEQAGCTEAIIVLGSAAQQIADHLATLVTPVALRVVHNPDFALPNGVSLMAAEPFAAERFYLQMADHVFASWVLARLDTHLGEHDGATRLLVDHAPDGIDLDDATKVHVEHGLIRGIGKQLVAWNAVDTGYFRLDHRVFEALRAVQRDGTSPSVSAGMMRLAEEGALAAVALEQVAWADVDTPADWIRAERLEVAVSAALG
jgi:choline kinase